VWQGLRPVIAVQVTQPVIAKHGRAKVVTNQSINFNAE